MKTKNLLFIVILSCFGLTNHIFTVGRGIDGILADIAIQGFGVGIGLTATFKTARYLMPYGEKWGEKHIPVLGKHDYSHNE